MPSSNRPSPRAAMEDDGADSPAADALRATPPRPNKRSKSSSRSRRRRRSPNPNPRPRPDYYGTEPSRKSERKRKPRSFPDAALLSRALLPRASPSRAAGGGGNVQLWTDADELALLSGAVAFRAGSGRAPRLPDTGPLFESIRDSLSPHIDQSKVYYKLKRLKSKFCNTALSATSTAHDRRVRDLSAAIWAADLAPPPSPSPPPPPALALEEAHDAAADDDAEDEDDPDDDEGYAGANVAVGPRMPLVSDLLGEYWKRNARTLSGVSLEKGLALVGADEGMLTEAKWRRQLDAEMRSQVRRHDLAKEVFSLLIDTVKGLGP
ncbi:hypothetical protein QYE76_027351 [Lolium multiflorum]|uniref:Glabrous enhancer-binding protein-like DBD domain-containing protein n=1 Tax=Lolium multiflorum TaxID=4521 RepID=A0AAD8VG02_LOLMU|nr:hypothetical protein QYE76_027351 [Lolium multiflorum]